MHEDCAFQKSIVEYLESVHIGEFLTGSHCEVLQNVSNNMIQYDYVNPKESLPVPPPSKCRNTLECGSCINCNDLKEWQINFGNTVDDILLRSNIHTCRGGSKEYKRNTIRIEVIQIIYRKSSIPLQDAKVINMRNVKHSFLKNY